jgi:hypothetical protein
MADNAETAVEKKYRLKGTTVWSRERGEVGPIWADNAFAGEFGDNFIADTSLEGGHIPEAIRRLLDTVVKYLPQFYDTMLNGLTASDKLAVKKSLQYLESAGDVGINLNQLNDFYIDFPGFAQKRINEVRDLQVGSMTVWPGGWSKPGGGHAIMYIVEKTSASTVSWVTCNTGDGIGHHPCTQQFYPKEKRKLAIRIDNIPVDRLANEAFLYILFRLQAIANKSHNEGMYYQVVLPFLIGAERALSTSWNHDDPFGEWETPQKAGTCFFRCVLCTLKYLLRRQSVKNGKIKLFFHAIRQAFLLQALEDLKDPKLMERPIHHSQAKLVKLASTQTAYSAVKECQAGRLNSVELHKVKSLCEEVDSMLEQVAVTPLSSPQPLLKSLGEDNGEGTAVIEFKPCFDKLVSHLKTCYVEDTDHLKGKPEPLPRVTDVNYLACPDRANIRGMGEISRVLQFLQTAVDATLVNPKKSEGSYEVVALFEYVFNRIMPCPTFDAADDHAWVRGEISRSERDDLRSSLEWCSKQYSAARVVLPPNDLAEGVRIVTHAKIMLCYWALLRCRATDFSTEEKNLHNRLQEFRAYLPESNAKESFQNVTAELSFVSPHLTQSRGEVCAALENLKRQSGSRTLLFDEMIRGKCDVRPGSEMIEVVASFNDIHSQRKGKKRPHNCPVKTDRSGREIVPSEEAICVGWLTTSAKYETSHIPDFYGLRDMLSRYNMAINDDKIHKNEVRKGSPNLGYVSIGFDGSYDEQKKSGKTLLKFGGKEVEKNTFRHEFSRSNLQYYSAFKDIRRAVTEEDILFAKTLPNFDDTLSEEDAERLCSYLTVPYLRIPLLLDFFANGRVGHLFNSDLRDLLYHSLLSAGRWANASVKRISQIPCATELVGCSNGILWNELTNGPQGCLEPLLRLLNTGADQCVEDYKSAYVVVFLYLVRIGAIVQRYLLEVMTVLEEKNQHLEFNRGLSSFLNDKCASILERLLSEAIAAEDKTMIVVFYAHMIIANGNFNDPARQLDYLAIGKYVGACAFVKSWHLMGVNNENALGGILDDEVFWAISNSRPFIDQWYRKANVESKKSMLEHVVQIATSNKNAIWSSGNSISEDGIVSSTDDSKFTVNRQTMQVSFKKSGLELVPEEIANHPDFTHLFPRAVPHCAYESRFTNRHVVIIAKNQMRIENWRKAKRGTAFVGAPTASVPRKKIVVEYESTHPYTNLEQFRSETFYYNGPGNTRQCFITFDSKSSTYPTLVCGSSDHFQLTAVSSIIWPDGKREDLPQSKDMELFGGPGADVWKCEYIVQGKDVECGMCKVLDDDQRDKPREEWLYGVKINITPDVCAHEVAALDYRGICYTRMYHYPSVPSKRAKGVGGANWNASFDDVAWVFDILDPVLDHEFSKPREKQQNMKRKVILAENGAKYTFLFPRDPLPGSASHCNILVVQENGGCEHEIHVSRGLRTIEVFNFKDHGRYLMPSLQYTSDSRFSLAGKTMSSTAIKDPLPSMTKYSAGLFLSPSFHMQSIVATDSASGTARVHVPAYYLSGRIPDVLLEHFEFWKTEEGYLESVKKLKSRTLKSGEEVEFVDPFFDYDVEINVMNDQAVIRRINKDGPDNVLVNHKTCAPASVLERLVRLLSRFEAFSHVLMWADVNTTVIDIIEMPRLLSKFKLRGDKLYSLDQSGMFVSDKRNSNIERFMQYLPHSILLENKVGKLVILCPNRPFVRPDIKSCPFSGSCFNLYGDPNWLYDCHSRTFSYEMHVSGRFVLFPSVSATFYWAYCMLLGRNYKDAAIATDSCDTDMPLTRSQQLFLKYFDSTTSDKHPDAVACRLKLRLALIYANLPKNILSTEVLANDLVQYTNKRSHVSAFAQISLDDETKLLEVVTACKDDLEQKEPCKKHLERIHKMMSAGVTEEVVEFPFHVDSQMLSVSKPDNSMLFAHIDHEDSRTIISGAAAMNLISDIWENPRDIKNSYYLLKFCVGRAKIFLAEAENSSVKFFEMLTRILTYIDKSGFGASSGLLGIPNSCRAAVRYMKSPREFSSMADVPLTIHCKCYHMNGLPSDMEKIASRFQKIAVGDDPAQMRFVKSTDKTETIVLKADDFATNNFSVSNYGNSFSNLCAVNLGAASISGDDYEAFTGRPLAKVANVFEYVEEMAPDETTTIPTELPFDLSGSEIVASKFGQDTVKRLSNDMASYANKMNQMKNLSLRCISKELLEDYNKEYTAAVDSKKPTLPKPSFEASAKTKLNELVGNLKSSKEKDVESINSAMKYLLKTINNVDFEGDENDLSRRYCFALKRYVGMVPRISWEDLVAVTLSETCEQDILRCNPFLKEAKLATLLTAVAGVTLRTNRISHLNWAISSGFSVLGALKSHAPPKNLIKEVASLTTVLCMSRHYIKSNGEFDPRFMVFEYLFGLILRKSQVYLINTFVKQATEGGTNLEGFKTKSMVHQMIMGAGKTTVIGPLMALMMADGKTLVTQVVPDALLEMSRSVMWNRFAQVIPKRIYTLSFGRGFPARYETVNTLFKKLKEARNNGGIVCTTPATIKSIVNRYVELMNNGFEFVNSCKHLQFSHTVPKLKSVATSWASARLSNSKKKSQSSKAARVEQKIKMCMEETKAAHGLAEILHVFRSGILLMDEVDMLLHPLRSELNFPVGDKYPLTPAPHRWSLPIHIIDGFLYAASYPSSLDQRSPPTCLNELKEKLKVGFRSKAMQTVPHTVLIDQEFYASEIRGHIASWVIVWLRSKHFLSAQSEADEDNIRQYLLHGASCEETICDSIKSMFDENEEGFQMMNLGHNWVCSILPHILGKINRISFGLLTKQDLASMKNAQPLSRQLCAVPFMGKDVPSGAAEFAQPDCLIGSTILAYRYEGLRMQDVKRVIVQLKYSVQHEPGSLHSRPSYMLFEHWVENACRRNDRARTVPALDILQPSEERQILCAFNILHDSAEVTYYYLETFVFPKCMMNQKLKIGSSGQELGSDILFGRRLGFSGTPSNLLPLDLQPCRFENGSEGKVLRTLSAPQITTESVLSEAAKEWDIKAFLDQVASGEPKYHALIDTGALITGYSNADVARYLIDNGLPDMEGCVYLDESDCKMVYTRGAVKAVPLSECGLAKDKRFTFYDQVHTTGMDIKQALSAVALLTLGKDMIFRDYAQGAYRMRGIGAGQTIQLYIIPEVKKIIQNTVPRSSGSMVVDACAWLQLNGIRQEKMQFMQLCTQNTATVGRKEALSNLLKISVDQLAKPSSGTLGLKIFKEESIDDALEVLRETVSFDIPRGIPKSVSFVESLNDIRRDHKRLIHSDKQTEILDFVKSQAESLVAGNSLEGNSIGQALGGEMTREKEREQEQEQQRQQQQQAQISYGNPRAVVIPWDINVLVQNGYGEESDGPFFKLQNFSPRPDPITIDLPSSAGEEKQTVPGILPLNFPEQMFLSSNYLDKDFNKTELLRIRNVSVVLEWLPTTNGDSLFAAVSLAEAEALRGYIHRRNGRSVPIALYSMENNRVIDQTFSYTQQKQSANVAKPQLVAFQFWDNEMFFESDEVKLLLKLFKSQAQADRKALFSATLLSRRRDRSSWLGTPVSQVFDLESDEEFADLLNFIGMLATELRKRNLSIINVCNDMDLDGDGYLSRFELQEEISSLVPSASVGMISKLIKVCDTDGDDCIDYDEFARMLQHNEGEQHNTTLQIIQQISDGNVGDTDCDAEEKRRQKEARDRERREKIQRLEERRRKEREAQALRDLERQRREEERRLEDSRRAEQERRVVEAASIEREREEELRRQELDRKREEARKIEEERRIEELARQAAEGTADDEERKRLEQAMAERIAAERLRKAAEAARLAAEALRNQTILDGLEAREQDRQDDVEEKLSNDEARLKREKEEDKRLEEEYDAALKKVKNENEREYKKDQKEAAAQLDKIVKENTKAEKEARASLREERQENANKYAAEKEALDSKILKEKQNLNIYYQQNPGVSGRLKWGVKKGLSFGKTVVLRASYGVRKTSSSGAIKGKEIGGAMKRKTKYVGTKSFLCVKGACHRVARGGKLARTHTSHSLRKGKVATGRGLQKGKKKCFICGGWAKGKLIACCCWTKVKSIACCRGLGKVLILLKSKITKAIRNIRSSRNTNENANQTSASNQV